MAEEQTITVPDIGGASGVDVIEILVKKGDTIEVDTPLITLESDKASMEIPSPKAGVVHALHVKLGDKISEGDDILTLEVTSKSSEAVEEKASTDKDSADSTEQLSPEKAPPSHREEPQAAPSDSKEVPPVSSNEADLVLAGPAARRLARELGVDLTLVSGSGRKARISKDDITQYVKERLRTQGSMPGVSAAPVVDFSQFGSVTTKPLSKIKRLTGVNVHRAWVNIPHVTQFDEADITDLEAFRQAEAKRAVEQGYKLTLLAFVCKVVAKALAEFPQFNASLDPSGEQLIYKQYYNVGIAVDTPNGLVVPVLKGVDRLSVNDIAKEMARLSTKAREKGLMPNDMSGGCMTISSLGGISGTAFTPIVNSPEVAILGLSRASMQPVYENGEFKPRLILPVSLSYDHRVIDGAEAARFTRFLRDSLSDIRRILL